MTIGKGRGTCAAPQTEPPHASLWQAVRDACDLLTWCGWPFCRCERLRGITLPHQPTDDRERTD
jgi:hypothetical protein